MADKIREFFLGTVVLQGPWTFFFRFMEIVLVGLILTGLVQQFR
jgi:hypothetical protein